MNSDGHARFRIKQNGLVVAQVDGPLEQARREITHYAALYAEEGPITLEINSSRGKWRRYVP